jgi:hypothetical protein
MNVPEAISGISFLCGSMGLIKKLKMMEKRFELKLFMLTNFDIYNFWCKITRKKWCEHHGYSCDDPNCRYRKFDKPQPIEECIYCGGCGIVRGVWGIESCPVCKGKGVWVKA